MARLAQTLAITWETSGVFGVSGIHGSRNLMSAAAPESNSRPGCGSQKQSVLDRPQAGSWLALRAAALRRAVSSPSAAPKRGDGRFPKDIGVRIAQSTWKCGARNIVTSSSDGRRSTPKKCEALTAPSRNCKQLKASALQLHPKGSCCIARATQVQWVKAFRATAGAVLANRSLNRTHCSRPPFGLKKPSPNASPPQWPG